MSTLSIVNQINNKFTEIQNKIDGIENSEKTKISNMSIKELKAFIKERKIKGYSKYTKKSDIVNFILERI
jgi:GTP-binding protein EngB required for normal cell division